MKKKQRNTKKYVTIVILPVSIKGICIIFVIYTILINIFIYTNVFS